MGRWRRSSQYRSLTAGFALTAGLTVVGAGLGLSGSFNATASPAAASTPSSPAVGAAQSSPATKGTPVNLLTGNQSTFTTSTGGWSGSQGVVTWNGTSGDPTPGSLELTSSGAKGASAWSASSGGTATPAQPGEVSEGTAFVEAVGGSRGASAVLEFYGTSGGILDVAWGQAKTASPGGWVSLPPVVGLAPAGTVSVGLGIVDWAPTQGAQLLIDTASLEALRDSVSPLTGPLSTSGTEVLDARGHHVVLRGIDYSGLELTAYPAGFTEHTFAQMRAWGADTVRVDLYGPMLLANSCAYWPQYVNEVNQAVNWITSLGMLAVLELHMVNPADLTAPKSACPPATNEIMADAPGSITLWRQLAARYAANPLVAFDLYNEPHNIPDKVWLNGGTVGSYHAAGMQQLYNAVRSAGAQNLVFVTGVTWGNEPPPEPLAGYNVVYSVHYYTCPVNPPPNCANQSPFDPAQMLDRWSTFAQHEPVVVGEFGFPDTYSGTYIANVISFAEKHGWGWVVYTWDGYIGRKWDLVGTNPSTGTIEPSPAGMPALLDMAQKGST